MNATIKKKLYKIMLTAGVYGLSYFFYRFTSHGLGWDDINMQLMCLLPTAIACLLPVFIMWNYLDRRFLVSHVITALAWVITGPLLYYWTYADSALFYFENAYDIYFGLYLFAALISLHLLLIRFLTKHSSAIIITIVQCVLLVIPGLQWIYYALYHSCLTSSGALIIYQTTPRETLEYIMSLGQTNLFFIALAVIIVLLGMCRINFVRSGLVTVLSTKKRMVLRLAIILIPVTFFLGDHLLPQAFPMQLFTDTKDYFKQAALYKDNHTAEFASLSVTQLHQSQKPHTIIMVIGESETRTLMNVYNPDYVKNTPWLTAEASNPNFTIFRNAYSCVWYTVPVLEHALTESNFYNDKKFNESVSIIDVARKAGYKTYWFSNQGTVGISDTPITLVAETADMAKWTNQNIQTEPYDESLISFLDLVNPNENNFIVLHLMGSHIEYRNRYPYTFQQWIGPEVNQKADYDNSVLYTDWVLQHIFNYAQENLHLDAMVYFSDHGTDPTVLRKPDETGFKVLRIPFFTYVSDQYIMRNPEVYKTLKAHANNFFTNDLMYPYMCGILNVVSNHYDDSYSLASPNFKLERKDLVTRFGMESLLNDKEF